MSKRFRLRRVRGGRRHLLETDSPAEYVRWLVTEMAEDFSVDCDVTVREHEGAALDIEVRAAGPANRPSALRFEEYCDELAHVFTAFYECTGSTRRSGWRAWRVRHREGRPWI